MKITINSSDLIAQIPTVKAAIGKRRKSLPILSALLIEAGDDGIACSATNLNVAYRFPLAGTVVEPGQTAVDAVALGKALSAAGKGVAVELEATDKLLTINLPSGVGITVEAFNPSDFPVSPWPASLEDATPAAPIIEAMAKARHAAASDENRPVLATVYVSADENGGVVRAADGFRLARIVFPATGWTGDILVPAELVDLVGKAKLAAPRMLVVERDNASGLVWFAGEDGRLAGALLVDGRFPGVDSIIPVSSDHACIVDGRAVTDALRITKAAGGSLLLQCEPALDRGAFDISAKSSGNAHGKPVATLSIPVEFQGDSVGPAFALQPNFLADAIQAGERYRMRWTKPNAPIVFDLLSDGYDATFAIMPMHVPQAPGASE